VSVAPASSRAAALAADAARARAGVQSSTENFVVPVGPTAFMEQKVSESSFSTTPGNVHIEVEVNAAGGSKDGVGGTPEKDTVAEPQTTITEKGDTEFCAEESCGWYTKTLFGFQGKTNFTHWLTTTETGVGFQAAHGSSENADTLFEKIGHEEKYGGQKIEQSKFESYCSANPDKCGTPNVDAMANALFGFQGIEDFTDWAGTEQSPSDGYSLVSADARWNEPNHSMDASLVFLNILKDEGINYTQIGHDDGIPYNGNVEAKISRSGFDAYCKSLKKRVCQK
jgi:hypothetical protein